MRTVLLAGGTGGAKLAHGLQQVLPPGELTVIVNVGDDTERHGLLVCPDLDTILYTLAGLADAEPGLGRGRRHAHAPWRCSSDTATRPGSGSAMPTWPPTSRAGELMRDGATLTDATAAMAPALGVPSRLVPATDDRVRTIVETDDGALDFQTYFVQRGQARRGARRCASTEWIPRGPARSRWRLWRGGADRDRAIEPAGQHRPHPGHPRHARGGAGGHSAPRWGSAASSPARPSAGRPIGCSPRSATSRLPVGVAALYSGLLEPLRDRRGGRGAGSADRGAGDGGQRPADGHALRRRSRRAGPFHRWPA